MSASEAATTPTRVVGDAIDAGGAVSTKVDAAEVGQNLTRLAFEPSSADAHEVVRCAYASVTMTRVWVAVVSHTYKIIIIIIITSFAPISSNTKLSGATKPRD